MTRRWLVSYSGTLTLPVEFGEHSDEHVLRVMFLGRRMSNYTPREAYGGEKKPPPTSLTTCTECHPIQLMASDILTCLSNAEGAPVGLKTGSFYCE